MLKFIFAILVLSMNVSNSVETLVYDDQLFTKSIPYDETYERLVTSQDLEEKEDRLIVKYDVKDGDIYVECFVKDFSFSKEKAGTLKNEGEGHVHLYINDNKVDSIFTSSFIIKSLPIGTYKIKVELVHNDYSSYEVFEEFEVKL
ncbi:hypothetical protein DS745_17445 [Anaerobacillus alkaliphilus]|uniref:Uncharacterized protein n=1 Tax=Anaerobacillus alkaliphilus TaxID=1548597 RepID=A0A4Q0VPW1_9BACI|nr:hypothetical protein [Anaerobacillus alkaliphilus]RXI98131.1 hypothetical protein DS745_17445 [Anaerobacillus alkaliphilus]